MTTIRGPITMTSPRIAYDGRPQMVKDLDWQCAVVITYKLSPEYLSEALGLFQECDRDKDDHLSFVEFCHAMAAITADFPVFGQPTQLKLRQMFAHLDQANRGRIDLNGWLTGVSKMANRNQLARKNMEAIFCLLDTDNDGYIEVNDFGAHLRNFQHFEERNVEEELEYLRGFSRDYNKRKISKEEYILAGMSKLRS